MFESDSDGDLKSARKFSCRERELSPLFGSDSDTTDSKRVKPGPKQDKFEALLKLTQHGNSKKNDNDNNSTTSATTKSRKKLAISGGSQSDMDERVEVANDVSGRRTNFDLTRKRTNSSNGNRKKGATEDGTHSDVEKDLENDSHSEMDVNEGRRTPSGRKTAPASSMATKSSGRSRSPSLVFEPTCEKRARKSSPGPTGSEKEEHEPSTKRLAAGGHSKNAQLSVDAEEDPLTAKRAARQKTVTEADGTTKAVPTPRRGRGRLAKDKSTVNTSGNEKNSSNVVSDGETIAKRKSTNGKPHDEQADNEGAQQNSEHGGRSQIETAKPDHKKSTPATKKLRWRPQKGTSGTSSEKDKAVEATKDNGKLAIDEDEDGEQAKSNVSKKATEEQDHNEEQLSDESNNFEANRKLTAALVSEAKSISAPGRTSKSKVTSIHNVDEKTAKPKPNQGENYELDDGKGSNQTNNSDSDCKDDADLLSSSEAMNIVTVKAEVPKSFGQLRRSTRTQAFATVENRSEESDRETPEPSDDEAFVARISAKHYRKNRKSKRLSAAKKTAQRKASMKLRRQNKAVREDSSDESEVSLAGHLFNRGGSLHTTVKQLVVAIARNTAMLGDLTAEIHQLRETLREGSVPDMKQRHDIN
ncbi:protein starmaker-like isoform X2 [Varroa destructor]|uniref:Uncharacterized protein n=1 Tax=Varroa destructor TaxID=109461 RepID=A0A7M7J7X2_VARDE|nr:protein starmaker-like isoform X2 [Varroa destructor]